MADRRVILGENLPLRSDHRVWQEVIMLYMSTVTTCPSSVPSIGVGGKTPYETMVFSSFAATLHTIGVEVTDVSLLADALLWARPAGMVRTGFVNIGEDRAVAGTKVRYTELAAGRFNELWD